MKTCMCILPLIVACVAMTSLSQEPVPEHPKLFFNLQEANQIRNRALVPGSTENKFFLEIKEVADYFVSNPQEMFQPVVTGGPYTPFRQWNLYSLAFTYFVTQNPVYWQATYDIIFGFGTNSGLMGFQFVARNTAIVAGLAQTVDLLWDQFTENERNQILQKIQENLQNPAHPGEGVRDYFYNNYLLHDNNHMASQGMGLISAAIVFNGDPGYPEANSDIDVVRYRIVTYQNNLIVRMNHADGAPAEGVYYGSGQYGTEIPILLVLGRLDGVNYLQQEQFRSRYMKAGQYFCYEVLPAPRDPLHRQFTAINDAYMGFSNTNGLLAGLHVLSSTHNDGYSKWVFNNTVQDVSNLVTWALWHAPTHNACRGYGFVEALHLNNDTPPTDPSGLLSKSRYFPVRGLVYIRTSDNWADNNDIQFSLTAAPAIDHTLDPPNGVLSVKHNQPDKNSITLSAFGQDFIVDVGYEGQRPEDQNYILIDGRGQSPAAINGGMNEGRIAQYETCSTFDFVRADAKSAFDTVYYHGENGTPVPVVDPTNSVLNADRYALSTRATSSTSHFFVVADDIRRDSEFHQYKWIFNTYGSISLSNPIVIQSGGKYLKIWHTAQGIPQALESETRLFGGAGYDQPVVSQQQTQVFQVSIPTTAVNPFFHIIMVPQQSDETYPIVTNLNQQMSGGSCLKMLWSSYEDYSILKFGGTVSSSLFISDAKLSQVRKEISSGLPVAFVATNGSHLTFESRELVNLYGQQGTVMRSGTEVEISGASILYFRVYAPNATIVKLNAMPVPFVQVNDYIESANITVDRTWSGQILTSYSITVNAGKTLVLAPDATVLFADGTSLICNGTFLVEGEPGRMVTLSSVSPPNRWNGITVTGACSPTVDVQHAVISHAISALTVTDRAYCTIANSVIEYCDIGLQAVTSLANCPQIIPPKYVTNNTFSNVSMGISLGTSAETHILSNTITDSDVGISLTSPTYAIIDGNIVRENSMGISISGCGPVLHDNIIEDNSDYGVWVSDFADPRFGDMVSNDPGYNIIRNNNRPDAAQIAALTGFPFFGCHEEWCGEEMGGYNSIYYDVDKGEFRYAIEAREKSDVLAHIGWWGVYPADPGVFMADESSNIDYRFELEYDPNGGGYNPSRPGSLAANLGRELDGGDPPPTLSLTPEQRLLLQALGLRGRGQYMQALSIYLQLILNRPLRSEALVAVTQLRNCYRDFIRRSGQPQLHEQLRQYLSSQSSGHSNPRLRTMAKFLLAQECRIAGQLQLAAQIFSDLATANQNTALEPSALYSLVSVLAFDLGNREQAAVVFNTLESRYPTDPRTHIIRIQYNAMLAGGSNASFGRSGNTAAMQRTLNGLPNKFALHQNYPNPFNPTTTISFSLPEDVRTVLKVYDLLGREIQTLVDGFIKAGDHTIDFDASRVASGMYLYRLQAGRFSQAKKLILLR